jgi:hypothetical protein
MRQPARLSILLGLALAGCQTATTPAPKPGGVTVSVEEVEAWRQTATTAGQATLDSLDTRWTLAIADAKRRGATRAIAAEGALLDPRGGEARAAPAPGPYRCRLLRVAAPGARVRGIAAVRSGFCFVGVEGEELSLTTEVLGYRFGGYLYETPRSAELVFLGTSAARRGPVAVGYGEDPAKDVAGRFERVGEFRYRLAVPAAAGPELLVFELIPAPRA